MWLLGVIVYALVSVSSVSANQHLDVRPVTSAGVVGNIEREYVANRESMMPPIGENRVHPRIAICCSGGGTRAMLASAGFLDGLDRSGLLRHVSYISALSGSTWTFLPWLLSTFTPMELRTYLVRQTEQFSPNAFLRKLDRLIPYLLKQYFYYRRPSIIDIYGALLADTLLRNISNEKSSLQLSTRDLQPRSDIHPFLLTSVITPKKDQYTWVEITPYEIGSHGLQYYAPLEAFGSTFKNGVISSRKPAPKLGYLMGMLGSAISASMKEIIDMYLGEERTRSLRLLPASMPNFTRKLENSPFRKKRHLTFVDAGIDCNIPLPSLVAGGRSIDVIIICDASGVVENAPELRKAAKLVHQYGKLLPDIDYEKAGSQVCSIFESDNPYIPTVIYLPRIHNPDYDLDFDPSEHMEWGEYLNTFNFSYTSEQAQRIAGLMEYAVTQHRDAITKAITRKAAQLSQ